MIEELKLLAELQGIDNQLMEIEAEKGDLPEQLANLESEIREQRRLIEAAESKVSEINAERLELDRTISEAQQQLKKSQDTIYNVKTTREYDAISLELEHAKETIAIAEKRQVELMSSEEENSQNITDLNNELERFTKELGEKNAEMRVHSESSDFEEEDLRKKKAKLIAKLKKPVFDHYDRIKQIRDGIGASVVQDGSCGYCFSIIPPQRQAEVRRGADLFLCEVCGVYLVPNTEEEQ